MPLSWFIVEALIALARNRRNGKKPFTRTDLLAWSDRLQERPRAASYALDALMRRNLVRRGRPEGAPVTQGQWMYTLTPEGLAAAVAAEEARYRDEQGAQLLGEPGSYTARVYALLRVRKVLTGPEAAATLVDAGQDVKKASRDAAQCLSAWSRQFPDSIKPASKRVNGAVRYVLVQDIDLRASATASTHKSALGGASA